MDDSVSVPRWALEFVLENANFQDEGPTGEGWCSDEMEKAVSALNDSLRSTLRALLWLESSD